MELALSWDLVLVTLCVMLFVYGFLLGQEDTIKLIIGIYIAVLSSDVIAQSIDWFMFDFLVGFERLWGSIHREIFIFIRLTVFLVAVIIFVVRSHLAITLQRHDHWGIRLGIHALFSALSAVLFVSTFWLYLSGVSFVEGMRPENLIDLPQYSPLLNAFLSWYQLWFSLPALVFLFVSFLFPRLTRNN